MRVKHLPPCRLFMTTDAVGGVWRYAVDLCSSLTGHGAKILLACLGPEPSPAQRQEIAALSGVRLVAENYALEWMPNPWEEVDAAGRWLANLARAFQPDIVHLNGYSHAVLDWQAPVAVACHSCVFSWWRAVHGGFPGPDWAEYKRRVSAGLARADLIFSPTRHLASEMARIYDFAVDKLRVIPNFTMVDPIRPERKRSSILAAGRTWDQAKNLAMLDHISTRVHVPIEIASGLEHSEVLAQMAHARVFAHPAFYEPFGLAVLEAARHSCALVLADIPSLRESWDGAAVFLDPRDEEAWVQELNRIGQDADLAASLGTLARVRSNNYRSDISFEAYCRAYTALLQDNQVMA